jgi:colanic acid/amylovoran biosynthesis glycosyltransferase
MNVVNPNSAVRKPRRVLYVVSLFPCWSETFIVYEIVALIAQGVDVRILSLKPSCESLTQKDAAELVERVRYPLRSPRRWRTRLGAVLAHPQIVFAMMQLLLRRLWRHPLVLLKSLEALARGLEQLAWVRTFAPDIIHAHWATYPSTVAWTLARCLGAPFSFTCHAHDIFVEDQLLREKIEAAAFTVTISDYNINWLATRVTPLARERLRVVHCGVPTAMLRFDPAGHGATSILAVGRLDAIKGFDVLILALALLASRRLRFHCRIIGEGPQRAELQAAIERHALQESVELCGALPSEAVHRELYAATVFVLPSVVCADGNRDGIPLSLIEAMAAGTPVISTRVSGIPELIGDGVEGVLVAPHDAQALAGALEAALDDAGRNARFAQRARIKVENQFDARREAGKLLHLFAEACRA